MYSYTGMGNLPLARHGDQQDCNAKSCGFAVILYRGRPALAYRPLAMLLLFLFGEFGAGPGAFPRQVHGALAGGLIEINGEVLDRRSGLGDAHRYARKVFFFSSII